MKTSRRFTLSIASALAALSFVAGASRATAEAAPQLPPAAPLPPGPTDAAKEDTNAATASATWAAIKDSAYDQRADFITGLNLMMKRLETGIQALNTKRATMKDGAAADWDFNMKELINARDYLQSTGHELEKATESTWADAKDKVAQAWTRVRNAYDKVTHSTTS